MLTAAMTAPRTRKPAATKPTPAPSERPNELVEVAAVAQRKRLLKALRAAKWNLGHTAVALRLSGAPAVIQYLKRLGLTAEYDAAKADGRIKPGARKA